MIILSRNTNNKLNTIISKLLRIKIITRGYPEGSLPKEAAKTVGKNASSITPEPGLQKTPTDPKTELQKEIKKPENNPYLNPVQDNTKAFPEYVAAVEKHPQPPKSQKELHEQNQATQKSLNQAKQHEQTKAITQSTSLSSEKKAYSYPIPKISQVQVGLGYAAQESIKAQQQVQPIIDTSFKGEPVVPAVLETNATISSATKDYLSHPQNLEDPVLSDVNKPQIPTVEYPFAGTTLPNKPGIINEGDKAFTVIINELGALKSNEDKNLNATEVTKILKTYSGKTYTTTITTETKVQDISEQQLLIDMKIRGLADTDPGKTAVYIKLQDNTDYLVGESKNGAKITKLGQSYIKKKEQEDRAKLTEKPETLNFRPMIVAPPKISNDAFLETGKQKHLLVIYDETADNYYATAYFTSNKAAKFLTAEQFKTFQSNKESTLPTSNKAQHYLPLKNPIKINKEDIQRVKWDKEYFDSLSKEKYEELTQDALNTMENFYEIFNKDGLTKEDCLQMCKDYDVIAGNPKGKHPLSFEQSDNNKQKKITSQEQVKTPSSNDA